MEPKATNEDGGGLPRAIRNRWWRRAVAAPAMLGICSIGLVVAQVDPGCMGITESDVQGLIGESEDSLKEWTGEEINDSEAATKGWVFGIFGISEESGRLLPEAGSVRVEEITQQVLADPAVQVAFKGDRGDSGLPGPKGDDGAQGPKGDKPNHEWKGTELRLEKPSGDWGEFVDLKGEKGDPGTGSGDITAVWAGDGLVGGADTGDVTLDIATAGVTLDKISPAGAAANQIIKFVGGHLVWADDAVDGDGGGVACVNAGSGLAGGGCSGDVTLYISSGGVTSAHLAPNSVGPSAIADNAVGSDKLATGVVTSAKIADATITSNDLASGAVTQAKISASGASDGYVLTTNGSAMSWSPVESDSYWQTDDSGIHYGGRVGIGGDSDSGYELSAHGDAQVTSDLDIGGWLTVSGRAILHSTLEVDSSADFHGDVEVDGGVTADVFYADDDVNVGDSLFVDNYARVGGNAKVVGTVGVRTDPVSSYALKIAAPSGGGGIWIEGGLQGIMSAKAIWTGQTISADGGAILGLPTGSGTTVVVDGNNVLRRQSSSRRYKHNVNDLPFGDDEVLRLCPVSFLWNSTGEPDIGLIAEEVADILPDLVLYDAQGRPDAVKYDRLSLYLLQVIKAQKEQIAAQESRLTATERDVAALRTVVRALQAARE